MAGQANQRQPSLLPRRLFPALVMQDADLGRRRNSDGAPDIEPANTSADTLNTPSYRDVNVSREKGITGTHVSGANTWVTVISAPATKNQRRAL